MTVGVSAATATSWLNVLRGGGAGVTFTAPAVQAVRLHVGDPGASGLNGLASGDVARKAVTFGAASSTSSTSSITLSSTPPVWTNGGTNEQLTHIAVWDALTNGNYQYSGALSSPQNWAANNTFTLTTLTVSITPLAA